VTRHGLGGGCTGAAAAFPACRWAILLSMFRFHSNGSLCPPLHPLQLTIEALFLEAAARVVGAAPTHLSQQKGRDLEDLAFDWLLAGDANLAFPDPKNHKNWVRMRGRSRGSGSHCMQLAMAAAAAVAPAAILRHTCWISRNYGSA